jgi:hypothetical protein
MMSGISCAGVVTTMSLSRASIATVPIMAAPAGQFGVAADVDEFARHDAGDAPPHQIVIARHHPRRREFEAGAIVELVDDANHLAAVHDRKAVEVGLLEALAELADRHCRRHGHDVARHVVGDDLFEEFVQADRRMPGCQ